MKTIKKTLYLVMLFAAVMVSSCNKDDDNNDNGGGNGGGSEFLTAKVDGSNYEAAQSPAVIVGAQSSNGVLVVQGGTNDGETIRINIGNYNGPGTYHAGDFTNPNTFSYITLPNNLWMGGFGLGSGTVNVTSDNGTTVEGTFSFEGVNGQNNTTKSITEGQFKATID
ncbi:MAG: DUF6252 family protein [Flavobacteriales bacterium]